MAEKVTILNRGKREYHLSKGRVLKPGESAEVEGREAKLLLDQRDLADASKVLPSSPDKKELEKKNSQLEAENAALKKELGKGDGGDAPEFAEGDEVEMEDGKRALVEKLFKNGKAALQTDDGKVTVEQSTLKKVS